MIGNDLGHGYHVYCIDDAMVCWDGNDSGASHGTVGQSVRVKGIKTFNRWNGDWIGDTNDKQEAVENDKKISR